MLVVIIVRLCWHYATISPRSCGKEPDNLLNYRGIFSGNRPDLLPRNPHVVFITGATSGIGHATALLLVALGHQVAAVGRREERLQALVESSDTLPGKILPLVGDVTEGEGMTRLAAQTLAHFGRLDVLVANAGLGHRGGLAEARWQDLEAVLRTNIDGVLHSVRACVPPMRASQGGHIIMVSSVLGPIPAAGAAVYCASKAAVDSLAQSLRMELKPDNIWVTNMLVGQTATEFAQKRRGIHGKVASKFPTMTPEKVAAQIVWAMERHKRTIILRPLDRLMVVGGRFFPWLLDRIMYRIYR
jgi:3-hydroxy acid dehydrogenase/malonic semialdehyde reductase